MKTVSASEAKQKFAAVIDAAAREPVVIRRQKARRCGGAVHARV